MNHIPYIGSTFVPFAQVQLRRPHVRDSYKASQRLYGKFAQFAPAWIAWRRSKRRHALCQRVGFASDIINFSKRPAPLWMCVSLVLKS